MRAVIYARYSSENQRDASIEDQLRTARAFLDRQGWTCEQSYSDRAQSGASMLRPGLQALLADALAGRFDVVVAEALDRLSRDQEHVAAVFKRLRFAGVRIVTLAEGEISELHVGLKGTMNALFLADLAQKTRRGLEGRVRQGRSAGGRCFGYDLLKEVDASGEPVRGGRTINDSEAEIVRRIFAEFAVGRSPRAIAKALNADGIPGPDGRKWRDTTIRGQGKRGTGILNNELYIGRLVWNRQRFVKDPGTGKRLARINPPEHWVVEEVPELRIVPDEQWQAAKERQEQIAGTPGVQKIKDSQFWTKRRAVHLLTGKGVCGSCGSSLAAIGRDYLACGDARGAGTCSNRQSIRRSVLEGLILDALRHNLMAPELVEAFVRAFNDEVNRSRREREGDGERRRRELQEITRKLDGLIEAIADGLRTAGLQKKLEELEQRKAGLEAATSVEPTPLLRLHPNLAELYRRKVEALHEALADPSIRDEALDLLRGLISRVVLHPVAGGFEIELEGDIARMVAVARGQPTNDKAASGCEAASYLVSSVKGVAGAGFEPATFRL